VLDFYIVEGKQRGGLGHCLFTNMLQHESLLPEELAYDRPSPKLLAFMRKHFGLSRYSPQNNNFVVYDEYFSSCQRPTSRRAEQASHSRELPASVERSAPPPQRNVQERDMLSSLVGTSQAQREEMMAAGLPSGGRQGRQRAAQALAGRPNAGCNRSASPLHHAAGRISFQHSLQNGCMPVGAPA
jgi:hypothetical protein